MADDLSSSVVDAPPAGEPAAKKTRDIPLRRTLFRSRIARLILASNLAGLAVLIAGSMILNEMRAGLVVAQRQSLATHAQIIAGLLAEEATVGEPEPVLQDDLARDVLRSLDLPFELRAIVTRRDGVLVGDSFFLSDRVDISALPPIQDPSAMQRMAAGVSDWAIGVLGTVAPRRGSAVRTRSFGEEFGEALRGREAASQRFSDRGTRVVSVSIPIQRVSAVVGVLTVESGDVEEIIRAERAALIPFIAVAMLVALVMSGLLTYTIARPLRRLATAADRVRTGRARRLDLPKVEKRRDEIGQLAQSMEAMTQALFDRIVMNERFAADVAHELKNPLTSIRSAVETAELVQNDPDARERLRKVIAQDVKRIDRLITDISNASRLEAEIARLPSGRVDISRLISDIVQTYAASKTDGRAAVRFSDNTMGAGLLVPGREGPLSQVVRNLVDNACSFSPPDAEVSVALYQTHKGPQTIARISVEDDGPGIPEDKLDQIFDRFYTDRPEGSAFGNNSGLGLSIVKQIVATHSGDVRAENRSQGGARFIVDLPAV
ncbi:MAG: stimulus-sensing domain-containing protein [Pseudomonadota bacterium]